MNLNEFLLTRIKPALLSAKAAGRVWGTLVILALLFRTNSVLNSGSEIISAPLL
jgi:hypothetical protein